MRVKPGETVVAVGATDSYRYIFVAPPLNENELEVLHGSGDINPSFHIEQIDEFPPACTFLSVVGDDDGDILLNPVAKTERAQQVAVNIASTLRRLREGHVQHNLELVGLTGHNSSPFNPNTDRLRVRGRR
jgi:hypothetical protein